MLMQGFRLRGKDIKRYLFVILFGFVLGQISVLVAVLLNGSNPNNTVEEAGTLMAAVMILIVFFFGEATEFHVKYNAFVGFGMTRRKFYVQEIVTSFVIAAILGGGIMVLHEIEQQVFKLPLYRQLPHEFEITMLPFGLDILFLLWVLFVPTLRFFFGCMVIRFGSTLGALIVWAFWMTIFKLPADFVNLLKEGPKGTIQTILYKAAVILIGISFKGWIFIAVVITILLYIVSWLLIRKKAVT